MKADAELDRQVSARSIDTPEFRALADKWQLCLTTDIERVYSELVAFIDGRTAGTAPAAWALELKNGSLEFNGGYGMYKTEAEAESGLRRHLGSIAVVPLYRAAPSTQEGAK